MSQQLNLKYIPFTLRKAIDGVIFFPANIGCKKDIHLIPLPTQSVLMRNLTRGLLMPCKTTYIMCSMSVEYLWLLPLK